MEHSKSSAVSPENMVSFFKRKSQAIFSRLKKFDLELTTDLLRALDCDSLNTRFEWLEQTQSAFMLAHDSLEELDFEEIGSKLRDDFDELSISLKTRVRSQLRKQQSQLPPSSTFRHDENNERPTIIMASRPRIPELKLPTFSGGYTEYADFSSMFGSIIDRDPDLSDIEKFQHLRSCLAGSALDAIRSLEMSSANYTIALELLSNRFNNKRLVFQAHINAILGLKKVEAASASKLRSFSDKLNAHFRALQTLGSEEQQAGCMIVYMLLQKVDAATQAKWEESAEGDNIPTAKDFLSFLEKRCKRMENVEHAVSSQASSSPCFKGSNHFMTKSKALMATHDNSCLFCNMSGHYIYACDLFRRLSPMIRLKEAKKLALCFNCLKKGHQTRACKSRHCLTCGAKHHTLLHLETSQPASSECAGGLSASPSPRSAQSSSVNTAVSVASSSPSTSLVAQSRPADVVLLATAIVLVKNRSGSLIPCRALLDSGSQLHLVTSRFAQQLQLKRTRSSVSVSGLGDTNVFTAGYTVNISLQAQASNYSTTLTAQVARTITDSQPNFTIDTEGWRIPSNIQLADPSFYKPQRVDLLIGASLFYELLCIGQIKLVAGLPLLQKTQLGWVVSGGGQRLSNTSLLASQNNSDTDMEQEVRLDEIVRQFWEVESCSDASAKVTKEDLECEAHFVNGCSRSIAGEYSVRLPFKLNPTLLGDSYMQACRRFANLERKLDRLPQLKAQYSSFIKEYLELNHMSLVSPDSRHLCKYFLPHHCVLKEDSSTTKLRVVFDGSASTSSGYSLNDLLMSGPVIQPKLFNILIRFRTYPVALTGDICKMYRCVRVTSPDNYLQCIVWRNTPQEKMQIYKLDTVTYGTKPASFLAVRAMKQLAADEHESFPLGSSVLQRDFYVDDLISGGNSISEARKVMQQTSDILRRGNFILRKWCSSHPAVLQGIAEEDKEKYLTFNDVSGITKTLGLIWNPASDQLLFSLLPLQTIAKPSKRSVLSTIAHFYDPLGLLGPVIAKAKIFLQQLWKEKLEWDESLPSALHSAWLELCSNFDHVRQLSFPRLALLPNENIEVHGFCDASIEAYGACIYIVSRGKQATSHLLCAKSRVAPLKALTVPKLELCGASLLAQLMHNIKLMGIFKGKYYCWSDSTIALSWICDESCKFNIFVANRVAAVQELTHHMDWRYVPTALNPADILSRGALPSELMTSELWFHGPKFLIAKMTDWPASCRLERPQLELRRKAMFIQSPYVDIVSGCKYANSFPTMQRIFAYVYKFSKRIRHTGISVSDVHHGTHLLLRLVQRSHLWNDIMDLQSKGVVKKNSSIASLAPFLDTFGLLRVGGRLQNSTLSYEAQHPIILPRQHPMTIALITHFHVQNLHTGPRALLAHIRLQYWPIGGRKTVSKAVNKCLRCFRAKPRLVEHIMAALPKERLESSRAFTVTGVDYCGPFFYKSEVRSRPPVKCYISVFICFTTKAVHMELVKDLSTASFLSCLKRFIATRGKPSQIWSDNATNFVGARNELLELKQLALSSVHQEAVHQFCLADAIDWRFIPPRSPHFGGLWEAAVKTAKHHFYRAVGPSLLSFDELRTLVCHIAAIMNSRPLLSLSENPADLDVLTPAHFLMSAPQATIIEPDITKLNFNRLDGWQRVTYLQQVFWSRWREEYLTLLQQRAKWRTPSQPLSLNDVVLIKDENLPPLNWPLGRVIGLIPGKDGVARIADLKTATGVIRRAVNKLCLLPLKDAIERQASNGGSMFG